MDTYVSKRLVFQWIRIVLADLFLHAYEADFFQWLLKNKDRTLTQTFNSSFRYIDDVLTLNNSRFCDYLHRIFPNELEIKETTDTQKYASYRDLHLDIDSGGRYKTKLYDKRDDFTFPSVNFPFIISNIPASPAYGVYISQLIRKSYSNKATLLLGRSHCCKNSMVVITIWLSVAKYPYLK
jgi:hypothetical protein